MRRAIFCAVCCLTLVGCTNTSPSSAAAQAEQPPLSSRGAPAAQQPPASTPTPLNEKDIKRREQVHKMMLAGRYAHDGAGELLYIGDMTSVPALLRALKDNPPYANGMMICTTGHILAALRKITGHNAGKTYEEWNAWWEQYQKEKKMDGTGQPNKGMNANRNQPGS